MRILFVSHAPLKKELGASKVLIELAEEMELLGWRCRLLSLMDLAPGPIRDGNVVYAEALREYLREHAAEYDVVDYDHAYLPYPRSDFPPQTALVARSVLLAHHVLTVRTPLEKTWKANLRALVSGRRENARREEIIKRAHATMLAADLVNVANHGDETTLIQLGIPKTKIVVLPYGLSRQRRVLFDEVSTAVPAGQRIAFLGTFDSRKGATDLPEIVRSVVAQLPGASFCLLGTTKSAEQVLSTFSKESRRNIAVVPRYAAGSVHELLAPCSIGVFPSYVEGFGFGILEMLAAGVPVIAYDVPGPPMMLTPEYLVDVGDTAEMSRKVVHLLTNQERLAVARSWAKERSREFAWPAIARKTSETYLAIIQRKKTGIST